MKNRWTKATVTAVTTMIAALFVTLAPTAQAQYSNPWAYNNNAYFNYAMAHQKAKATGKKSRRSRHARPSKTAKKTSHPTNTPRKTVHKK